MTRLPSWAFWLLAVALMAAAIAAYRGVPRSDVEPTPTVSPTPAPPTTPTPLPTPTPIPVALTPVPGVVGRPNVVLITVDTVRADHVGAYGSRVQTPNIDELARAGVRFTMPITEFTQTNPSHASILTGLFPQQHRLMWHGVDTLKTDVPTLAEELARSGYKTAAIYSWPSLDPHESGLDRGFQNYRAAYYAVDGETTPGRTLDGRADITTDAAIKWLREVPQSPFFLWVHYQDPHLPYTAPPPYDTMYDPVCPGCPDGGWETITDIVNGKLLTSDGVKHVVAAYDGEITFADHEIGRLLAEMKATGRHDNTMYIVTGDHGEAFAENGLWFHPWVMYNTATRVPLIVSYPPAAPQGRVVDAVVQHIDIMPTVLQLLGVPVPGDVAGRSLWPLMLGLESGEPRAAFVQVLDNSSAAIVYDHWKLMRDNRTGSLKLYDLATDPGEDTDLAQRNPDQASRLEGMLRAWMDKYQAYYERRM